MTVENNDKRTVTAEKNMLSIWFYSKCINENRKSDKDWEKNKQTEPK